MRATAVGPDLSRVIVRIENPATPAQPGRNGAAAGTTVEALDVSADEDLAAGDDRPTQVTPPLTEPRCAFRLEGRLAAGRDGRAVHRMVREIPLHDQKGTTAAWRSSSITMRKVRKAHGDKVVLDDVTLAFLPGAKIGVVGPERHRQVDAAADDGRAWSSPPTARPA